MTPTLKAKWQAIFRIKYGNVRPYYHPNLTKSEWKDRQHRRRLEVKWHLAWIGYEPEPPIKTPDWGPICRSEKKI